MQKPYHHQHAASNPQGCSIEGADSFGQALEIADQVRKLGWAELLEVAERVKAAEARLLRGERVAPNELREPVAFVREHTGADRTAAEVLS